MLELQEPILQVFKIKSLLPQTLPYSAALAIRFFGEKACVKLPAQIKDGSGNEECDQNNLH